MKKKLLIPVLILICYYFMAGDTQPERATLPCYSQINQYLYSDSLTSNSFIITDPSTVDTIVIRTTNDSLTLWNEKASKICEIMRDSCKVVGWKILIVDTSTNTTLMDTRFGRKIYYTGCP
jgi:hypothetical protein